MSLFLESGKKKAVTFSFDDGVTQDIRLIQLLDRYKLKCTFNINSDLMGIDDWHLTKDEIAENMTMLGI